MTHCPHNNIDCPCTKEAVLGTASVAHVFHHKEHGKKLLVCLRGIEWEK